MKTLSAALSHSALPLDPSTTVTENRSTPRTVPRASRAGRASQTPRVRNGAQAAMLAALGTFSSVLTLVYLMAKHPPLVILVAAPLWSLWLLSLVDWLRGDELRGIPVTSRISARASTQRLESVRRNDIATLSPCWQRVARSRSAGVRGSRRPKKTSGSG